MFDDIYSYIMKSFTDLKSIDEIMHIVDGIKGYGGLGYKPYYMEGGTITNKDAYETRITKYKNAGDLDGLDKMDKKIDKLVVKIFENTSELYVNEHKTEDIGTLRTLRNKIENAKNEIQIKKDEEEKKRIEEEERQRRSALTIPNKEETKKIVKSTKKYEKIEPNIVVNIPKEETKEIIKYERQFLINEAKKVKSGSGHTIYKLSYDKAVKEKRQNPEALALGDAVEAFVQCSHLSTITEEYGDKSKLFNSKQKKIMKNGKLINNPYYNSSFINDEYYGSNLRFFVIDYIKKDSFWEIKNKSQSFWNSQYFDMQKSKYEGTKAYFLTYRNYDKKSTKLYENKTVNIRAKTNYGKMECFGQLEFKQYYCLIFFSDAVIIYEITKDINNNVVGNEEYGKFKNNEKYPDSYMIPIFNKDGTMRSCFNPVPNNIINSLLNI